MKKLFKLYVTVTLTLSVLSICFVSFMTYTMLTTDLKDIDSIIPNVVLEWIEG